MNKNRIDKLVERAISVEGEFYDATTDRATETQLKNIEKKLDIILGRDFKYICEKYLYENLDGFYTVTTDDNYSIIKETLKYRKNLNLPHRFLCLYEEDTSVFLMETAIDLNLPSPVYWIHAEEVKSFCEGNPLQLDYDLFPSFTDFFENLIERKEESAREEQEYEESLKKE